MSGFSVLLWGKSVDYDYYKHHIWYQGLFSEIDIVAFATIDKTYLTSIDGIDVCGIDGLLQYEFDYLIDMNRSNRDTFDIILNKLGIPKEKRLPARVLELPNFSFDEYYELQKNPISIIAPNCWGAFTYNSLGLPFDSPFINTRIYREDYYRLLNNLNYYLSLEPVFQEWHRDKLHPETDYPIFSLGDVTIHFMHYASPEEALEKWNTRKKRIHPDNLLVADYLETEEEVEAFLALPFLNKVGFSSVEVDHPQIVYVPFCEDTQFFQLYDGQLNALMYLQGSKLTDVLRLYDVLRLLNHREDYRRY